MKVIVYGYSLGATDALDLSRRLDIDLAGAAPIKIHLMITIDAAVPFSSDKVNRRVGQTVRRNLNIFQTHPHRITGTCGVAIAEQASPTMTERYITTGERVMATS